MFSVKHQEEVKELKEALSDACEENEVVSLFSKEFI